MSWADLATHSLALVAYPGGLLLLACGLAADLAAGRLLSMRTAPRPAEMAALLAPPAIPAVLLAVVAATQLAIPFNPVSSAEQSVLVAVIALVAAAWIASAAAEPVPRPGLVLAAQVCWLVAMLAPAVAAGTMRPAALGAVAVPIQLPVKAAAGLLSALALPGVLQLLPETRPRLPSPVLFALWLPYCGLIASVFFPPAGGDVAGLVLFAAEAAAAAALAVGLAALLRRADLARLYWPALAVLAVLTVALATLAQAVG